MTQVRLVFPTVDDSRVSHDLICLTEFLTVNALADRHIGGFLGGEYGYGVEFNNETFMMHPFCWCEREDDCPWCFGCRCPEEAWIHEVRGKRVAWEDWLAEGNRFRDQRKDPALLCVYCKGIKLNAPNFLHKPTGTRVTWYKYIGRSMEVDLRGDWRVILNDCVKSLEAQP